MNNNILFLITKSEIGGAQRFVQEQMEILYNSGSASSLITNKPGWLSQNAKSKTVKFHQGIESKMSFSFLVFLCNFIKKNEITLVVCNSANGGFYGRIAALLTRSKSVYVSHGWSSIYNGKKLQFLFNFIERILGQISAGVLCISENDYKLAMNVIGLKKQKLVLIPNSILPLHNLSITKPNCPLKVLMVCRLDHPKRPDLLLEAVKSMGQEIQLTIVGDGPMMPSLRTLIGTDNSNIKLAGEITGFKNFGDFDVFALISESEGLPISALEAMSSGLALLLSDVGGCPSLIENNGFLVSNNIEAIQAGIMNLRKGLEGYKVASKLRFDKYHNLLVNTPKYLSFYNIKSR